MTSVSLLEQAPHLETRGVSTGHLAAKRILDVTVSLLLLVLLGPLVLLIALLIRLDSRGPAFFTQERVGARPHRTSDGAISWEPEVFRIYKFRSMLASADADARHEDFVREFTSSSAQDGVAKLSDDDRITRVGAVLRRTSVDELPQLFNVLGGAMSLVGPRPVPLYEAAAYDRRHWERFAARPGITGLWQVKGRGRVSFEQMMQLDIDYVRRPSIKEDAVLLLMTIPAVVRGKGAR